MIEFESVSYAFEDVPVLENVSLSIDDGEFVLLAGNGSGKTTLLRHCNGLLEPDSGDVLVDGTPVAEDLIAARSSVGMVFQHPAISSSPRPSARTSPSDPRTSDSSGGRSIAA